MREIVKRLWPEIDCIQDPQLREQVAQAWIKALERSPLPPDLKHIPIARLVPNGSIARKPCGVHTAILAAVAPLLQYELGPDGKSRQSERGEALRHPFTGVAPALDCLVPDSIFLGTEFRSLWMK